MGEVLKKGELKMKKYLIVLVLLIPLVSAEYFTTDISLNYNNGNLNVTTENKDDYLFYNITNINTSFSNTLKIHVWKDLSCSIDKIANLTSIFENLTYQMSNCREVYTKNGELSTKLLESCEPTGNPMCYSKLQSYNSCNSNLTAKSSDYDVCNSERTTKDNQIATLTKERDDEKSKKTTYLIAGIILTLVGNFFYQQSKKTTHSVMKTIPPTQLPPRVGIGNFFKR